MKNCWNILGIQPTTNSDEIKKAYRDLVKKYHPDKARSPEKVRHYTIKCAGIIEAYHRALQESAKLVTAPAVNDVRSARSRVASARSSWPAFIFCIVLLWVGLGMLGELLFDFKSGPLTLTTALLGWFSSLPLESATRKAVSGIITVPVGMLFGGVLAMFGPGWLWVFPVAYLENTGFSKLSYKLGWLLSTVAQYFFVYRFGLHWPFEHRATPYYEALYDISRFVGCTYLPLYSLWFWIDEYYRYARLKKATDMPAVPI